MWHVEVRMCHMSPTSLVCTEPVHKVGLSFCRMMRKNSGIELGDGTWFTGVGGSTVGREREKVETPSQMNNVILKSEWKRSHKLYCICKGVAYWIFDVKVFKAALPPQLAQTMWQRAGVGRGPRLRHKISFWDWDLCSPRETAGTCIIHLCLSSVEYRFTSQLPSQIMQN